MQNTQALMTYKEAITQAQKEEMERDQSVILIGEDLTLHGNTELIDTFDKKRLRSTPVSENSLTGMGVGAAMSGLRPIVDLTVASFVYLASDPIINQAAKQRYMTGGQTQVPIVFRIWMYYDDTGNGAQHTDRPYAMFMNSPGLKIIVPSTASDMKGLLKSAIRDNDPVLIFEDLKLWDDKELVFNDPNFLIPIGKADIKRPGSDLTLVSIGACLNIALSAAEKLDIEGISVEVIDPRTLVPMDRDAILSSIAKTGRLVIVENAHRTNGASAEIAAFVSDQGFHNLKAPIQRITTPDIHIPACAQLEKQLYPTEGDILRIIRGLIQKTGRF
jgi:pyruvate dehydrogenase E1 component beta subunit